MSYEQEGTYILSSNGDMVYVHCQHMFYSVAGH